MAKLFFTCPSCRNTFGIPTDQIPSEGGRGICPQCRSGLMIYPDGRILFSTESSQPASKPSKRHHAPAPPAHPPAASPYASPLPLPAMPSHRRPEHAEEPSNEPIWEVRALDGRQDLPVVRITLQQVRDLALMERLHEDDHARVLSGEWAPARSYPAIAAFFAELIQRIKEKHGDEQHCALHPDRAPGWKCHRCGDYLCQECVLNKPLVAGGADHYICARCEAETTTLKKKSAVGKVLFKKI